MDKVSTYQKMIVVKPADIDELDHVNNVVYLSWVQDIAKEHWQIRATQEIINQYKWVVVNHNITYKKPLKIHQKAFIKTEVFDNAKGALWERMVWIFDDSEAKHKKVHDTVSISKMSEEMDKDDKDKDGKDGEK